jgi:FtsP/CotA-like multicopper oxidase with cupredoxin domain
MRAVLLVVGLGAVAACGNDGPAGDALDVDAGVVPDAGETPLVLPPLIGATGVLAEVELHARYAPHAISDEIELDMSTYEGLVPGPVLYAAAGDEVIVHFVNETWQETTVHWHGLRISDQMDGSPRIQAPVEPETGTFTYRFVVPDAGTFWYHPHVRAHQQVELGLAAPIVVRDRNDPEYDAERIIVLDDILLDPATNDIAPFLRTHGEIMHGRWGNVLLTNGRAEVVPEPGEQGAVERWRLLNTANARTMELSVQGARMRVIGTDGGLLREPYEVERLTLSAGQRFDLEVTCDAPGAARLISHVTTVTDAGDLVEEPVTVYEVEVAPSARMPRTIVWPSLPAPAERTVSREVELAFDAVEDVETGLAWRINGTAHWHEPMFTFAQGDTVRMWLRNLAGPEHPFHLHGQFFEIAGEPGLRDTALVPGLETVEIVAYLDNPGRWMAHCHILEHAELGMMAEIQIDPR